MNDADGDPHADRWLRPGRRLGAEPIPLVLDAMGMGAWDWEVESGSVRWSPAVERTFGLQPGEFAGTVAAHEALVHPEDLPTLREVTNAALRQRRAYRVRYRVRHDGGKERWVETRGALAGSDETAVRVVGVCSDVTREVRRERADKFLAEAAEMLGATMDYDKSLSLTGVLAVPAMADWCSVELVADGDNAERSTRRRIFVAQADPATRTLIEDLEQAHPEETCFPFAVRAVIRSGHPELVSHVDQDGLASLTVDESWRDAIRVLGSKSYLCVPLSTQDRILGALTLVASVSGRHYDDEDLRMAQRLAHHVANAVERAWFKERAERAVAVRNDVLAIVSHDLRTPLNTIQMASTVLRGEVDHPQVRARLDAVDRAVKRADSLIRDLLDVARAETGSLSITPVACRIRPMINDAIASFSTQAQTREISLSTEVAESEDRVLADPVRIVQVLANLIGNALRYVTRGGKVAVRAELRGGEWVLAVVDDGPGIPEPLIPHLFQPFSQSHKRPVRTGAVGLGLSICRSIVDAHGGRIWLDREHTSGARFCFTLPIARPRERATLRVDAIAE
jgi:PAS domain S-box-containing protein